MVEARNPKKDFFISYVPADECWAKWIAWQLEQANYSTILEAWDFLPGAHYEHEMQKAMEKAERTIAVLSPNYLNAAYVGPLWAQALRRDPSGERRSLVPIRVEYCEPTGLLGNIIYIDLVPLQDAHEARTELLKKIRAARNTRSLPGLSKNVCLGLAGLTIGRHHDNTLILNNTAISSHHAEIRLTKQGFVLTDCNSTNGTFINNQRLYGCAPRVLEPGDSIRIAKETFVYQVGCLICPVCACPNPPTARVCKIDQIPLVSKASSVLSIPSVSSIPTLTAGTTSRSPAVSIPDSICPRCGYINRPGARFCKEDGTRLTPQVSSALAWVHKGDAFGLQQRYDEALNAYNQALLLDPKLALAHHEKGNILYKQRHFKESLAAHNAAIRYGPKNAHFHHRRGDALYMGKKYADALAAYQMATMLNDHLAVAYVGMAKIYCHLQQYNKALDVCEKALRIDPHLALAHCGKGHALKKSTHGPPRPHQEALSAYKRALELDPQLAEAYNGRGDIYHHQGHHTKALDAYDRALELDGYLVSAHIGRGKVLHHFQNYFAALDACELALSIDSEEAKAYAEKGKILEKLGKSLDAQQAYKKARALGYES